MAGLSRGKYPVYSLQQSQLKSETESIRLVIGKNYLTKSWNNVSGIILQVVTETENLFNCQKGMWELHFMLDFYYDSLIFKEL